MRIGIDFDNTLVVYDGAFHRAAESHFGMPPEVPKSKALIRSWFRDGPLGESGWVELQGIVYAHVPVESVPARRRHAVHTPL